MFCAALAVTAFSACSDDDEEGGYSGMPEITVNGGESVTVAGKLEGGKLEQTVEVVSKGDWTLTFKNPGDSQWVTPSAMSGKTGTTQLTFTLGQASGERSAILVLTASSKVEGFPLTDEATITVVQSDSDVPTGNALYSENCGTKVEKVDGYWPYVDKFEGWTRGGSLDQKAVTYTGNSASVANSGKTFDPAEDETTVVPGLIVSACMNTNPMMIYFGQEFGELGMDSEGFSGRDGRTTIFDYWSVDTIRRWRNGGKFDGKMLTEDQKHIYSVYQRILTLCNKEKAITEGEFFDLMYANANGWRFNEHKQYTFLRKAGKELLFIIVNFDHISVDVAINVPSHAFDFLQIPQMDIYPAVDLLTGKTESISLLPYKATEISVEGYSGKILKIKL